MNKAIPKTLQDDISSFAKTLEQDISTDLVSLVLYGGVVKNDPVLETDSIEIMVVVSEINTGILDRLGAAFRKSKRARQIQPLVLSEEDLRSSTDVFPIKFLDMQQDYQLLSGKDVLKDLDIHRGHLALRCEQEIKSIMLRLRRIYLTSSVDGTSLSPVMLRVYFTLLGPLDVLAELKTNKVYRSDDEILDAAAGIGLDVEPLHRIHGIRSGRDLGSPEEEKAVFTQLMQTVRQAAAIADTL